MCRVVELNNAGGRLRWTQTNMLNAQKNILLVTSGFLNKMADLGGTEIGGMGDHKTGDLRVTEDQTVVDLRGTEDRMTGEGKELGSEIQMLMGYLKEGLVNVDDVLVVCVGAESTGTSNLVYPLDVFAQNTFFCTDIADLLGGSNFKKIIRLLTGV